MKITKERIIELEKTTLTVNDIADELNICVGKYYQLKEKYNIPKRASLNKRREEQIKKIKTMAEELYKKKEELLIEKKRIIKELCRYKKQNIIKRISEMLIFPNYIVAKKLKDLKENG
jgi:DNA-binding helix-hairpin-helix protein with protein kinase domain